MKDRLANLQRLFPSAVIIKGQLTPDKSIVHRSWMEREDNIVTLTRIQYNPEDKVTRNARKVNRKVHVASLMVLCHLKHTEFTTHQ